MENRIVFMGSPDFALPSLQGLIDNFRVIGVVTQPDRPAGRGRIITAPPVKQMALAHELPVIQPRRLKDPEAFAKLEQWNPDVIIVAAYGQILRSNVLELPRFGCVNVHASLLPRWRGAAPIQAVILHGDQETGVTIMRMDAGVDTGGLLSQRAIPILDEDTAGSLSQRLSEVGSQLLIETLPGYLQGETQPQAQDNALATMAPMLKKVDGELDFNQPAAQLTRQVRAYNPWPGVYFLWKEAPFKVHQAHTHEGNQLGVGERILFEGLPAIGTQTGLLVLDEVQPPGKKAMKGEIFLRGARNWAS